MARSRKIDRQLDRYVGIPVIALIGMLSRRRALPLAAKRIGLIQPSAIGDMILVSGLLMHLRRQYPDAELHVFHGPFNGAAVKLLPGEVKSHACVFTHPLATLRELRKAKLDILINSAPWTRLTALLTALSGARVKVGFKSAGEHIHPAFDIAVPYLNSRHEVENHREVAQLFGPLPAYKLELKPVDAQKAKSLPYDKLVLIHLCPGGSCARQKSWPVAYWVELVRRLSAAGWVTGFTGVAADKAAIEQVIEQAGLPEGSCISLAGQLTLDEVSAAMMRSRLLITVDTGIAHLAAAFDIPVVALHGPTRFQRWGCVSAHATGLDSPHSAAGYINYGFEEHPQGDEVMARLTVDMVHSAVEAKLNQPTS